MNLLQKLLASLGLADNTSEEAVLSAVVALKARAAEVDGLQTKVAALTAQKPDPALYAPVAAMADLQSQVAALTAAQIANLSSAQISKIETVDLLALSSSQIIALTTA